MESSGATTAKEREEMKVTVIVTTFNRAHMVAETIDSILNQTFDDFELIVVDNCSSDDTETVIKGYTDERITYFKHENGGVVAVNRNYGIGQARGEYIAFCDDDDLWLPRKLEKQMLEFEKDSQLGLVCTNAITFDETGDLGEFFKTRLADNDFTLASLIWANSVICSSVLVKKSVIDDVGLMDTSLNIFTAEDYELWLRVAQKYRIIYIDRPLMRYRTHPGGYKKSSVAAIERNRAVYRILLGKRIIDRRLYQRLDRRALLIEFLMRTGTIKYASWILQLVRRLYYGIKGRSGS
jgi:glycosyltransferase involved in cell wall biosynthesis